MSVFTRLTVVGLSRKAEIVVPNEETVAALIPQLMDLLDEKTASVARPFTLIRSTGQQLDTALTLAEQNVAAGELLRLLRVDEAPAPPEVADVTDVVAEARDDRRGLWSPSHRRGVGAGAIGLFAAAAAWSWAHDAVWSPQNVTIILIGFAVLVGAAITLGRIGRQWPAIAVSATALGLVPALAFQIALAVHPAAAVFSVTARTAATTGLFAFVLGWMVIGLTLGVGLRIGPAVRASYIGVLLGALALVAAAIGLDDLQIAAVVGVVATFICGLLPWHAMSTSGLTGLDDLVIAGRLTQRDTVLTTVNDAYRSLTWSTVAVALPLLVTASVLAGSQDGWAIALGAAVLLVTVLRTRAFPLAVQAIVLWTSAVVAILVVALAHSTDPFVGGYLALAALVSVVAVAANPPAHGRARLRRLGNALEMVAVVSLLPVLLGVFKVYPDLLGTF